MKAIIGLGNPGQRYSRTRHNAGFWLVDQLAQQCSASGQQLQWENKSDCDFAKVRFAGHSCLLIKPQSYMNLSGQASSALLRFYKIEPEQVVVVYDELDLDPGVIRIRRGGSAGGHRGLSDMIRHLGDDGFCRLRIGIGHPKRSRAGESEQEGSEGHNRQAAGNEPAVSSWVLSTAGPKDQELLDEAVANGIRALEMYLKEGLESAQQNFNRKQITD